MVALMTEPKKSKLVGFQADELLHARVREQARRAGYETYAEWMRTVTAAAIDADEAKPTSVQPDIFVRLAGIYAGYLQSRLAHALESARVDQPKALHGLLSALCEHLARGCSVDDLVICPRSEWQPEPALMAAAEAPAPYGASPAPASPLSGMTKAQFKAQKPSNTIFSSESAVDQIAQEEAARREAAARKHGANPQKPHP